MPYCVKILLLLKADEATSKLCLLIEQTNIRPMVTDDCEAFLENIRKESVAAVVADTQLLPNGPAQIIETIATCDSQPAVVLVTPSDTLSQLASKTVLESVDAFLPQPFDPDVAAFQIRAAVERKRKTYNSSEHLLDLASNSGILETVKTLAFSLEAKDMYTLNHSRMVALYAVLTASALDLPEYDIKRIELASILHDIGKIAVRLEVLNKRGPLTMTEWDHIRIHPLVSEKIIAPIEGLRDLMPVVRHHHECFDGNGYPDRLAGSQIPLWSRIIAVADAYDALVSVRAYRPALLPEAALSEIRNSSGSQFDPLVVSSFIEVVEHVQVPSSHILLVDECPSCRDAFASALAEDGHQVDIVDNATDASEAVLAEDLDLVILDIDVPGARGFHLARVIRQRKPDIPIMMCTAMPGLQDDIALWELQLTAFLPKPTSPELLRQEVRRALAALTSSETGVVSTSGRSY